MLVLIFVLVSWLSCCTVLIVICRLSLLTAINIHHLDYRYDYTIYSSLNMEDIGHFNDIWNLFAGGN